MKNFKLIYNSGMAVVSIKVLRNKYFLSRNDDGVSQNFLYAQKKLRVL